MKRVITTLGTFALLLTCASLASAQEPASQGPLKLEAIKTTGFIAPDFKVTRMNGGTGTIAGVFGGRVFDDALVVGAGGYVLTHRTAGITMGYGGVVVGWQINADQPVSVLARGLFGAGEASLDGTTTLGVLGFRDYPSGLQTHVVRYRNSFFVAEPEIDLRLRVSDAVGVTVGAGYRAVSGSQGFGRILRGATGSVALQIKFN